MKKDIQRAALAAIIGALAVMTGCDQSNNSNMKDQRNNGKMQDGSMKNGSMKKGMDQSAKPMPGDDEDDQMHDLNQPQNGGASNWGSDRQKSNGSQYHYYCE